MTPRNRLPGLQEPVTWFAGTQQESFRTGPPREMVGQPPKAADQETGRRWVGALLLVESSG
jgi:hypothetical protein